MNTRERFHAVMNFEPVRTLKWEFGYWAQTVHQWYQQGLEEQVGLSDEWVGGIGVHGGSAGWREGRPIAADVNQKVGLDESLQRMKVNNYIYPPFEEEVLEEHDTWLLVRNDIGMIEKRFKDRGSLSAYDKGPVHDHASWEQLKAERLQPNLHERLPANWAEHVAGYKNRSFPLAVGGGHGLFSTPRFLFGAVQVLTAYYDHPELMHQIVNDLTDFWIALYDQVLDETDADLMMIWEDMCYNRGPLISPATFREFMLPGYIKLTNFLKDRGVQHVIVDTDGDVWKLLPLFLEGGVTGMYPFEVAAGMDICEVREAFPKLQILGGFSRTALAGSPETIDAELQTKVVPMLHQGGYIPYMDHLVPPDVSWDNFYYYRTQLNQLVDTIIPGS